MTEPPPLRSLAVAEALRVAWHAATRPDDPTRCPGCSACQAVDALTRARPEAIGHMEAAFGHLAGAGRELLAAAAAAAADRSETTDGAATDGAATDGATTDGATTDGATTDGATTDGAHVADRDGPGIPRRPGTGPPADGRSVRERITVTDEAAERPERSGADEEWA